MGKITTAESFRGFPLLTLRGRVLLGCKDNPTEADR